jgi:hypothetical protein
MKTTEKKSILNKIVKMRENKYFKPSFLEIAATLNELGEKGISDKDFTMTSVRAKYKLAKATNGK